MFPLRPFLTQRNAKGTFGLEITGPQLLNEFLVLYKTAGLPPPTPLVTIANEISPLYSSTINFFQVRINLFKAYWPRDAPTV